MDCLYNHCRCVNGPLWFLLCLFISNLFFFVIVNATNNIKHIVFGALIFGFIGLLLSINKYELPFCMSTSFTCIPFFVWGLCLIRWGYYTTKYYPEPNLYYL